MKKFSKILALALVLMLALVSTAFAQDDKAAEYLEYYYSISFEDEVTVDAFNDALAALGQDAVDVETLTLADVVVAAIQLGDMEELALTYIHEDVPDKASDVLAEAGVTVDDAYAPYVACALDLGLVSADDDFAGTVSGDQAAEILYQAAEWAGLGRRYIGHISDDDILTEVKSTIESLILFDEETLTNLGTEMVLSGATTGYNLKYEAYNCNFLPEYTIKYGHSDTTHALQLIALLESEGFDAYIQIEPKVSVYEYMIEWGTPGDATATYAVKEVEDTERYLAYAVEYDLEIEFETVEQKEAFHELIETYAKKYDDSYDEDGNLTEYLLSGSWWQPLYSSTTEMENEEFGIMIDNVILDETGTYSIHSFSLAENTEALAEVVAEITPELSVEEVTIYVNPAFIRYTTGEDYQ